MPVLSNTYIHQVVPKSQFNAIDSGEREREREKITRPKTPIPIITRSGSMMEQFGDVDRACVTLARYPGAGKGKFTAGRFSLVGAIEIDYSLIVPVRRAAAPAPVINGD